MWKSSSSHEWGMKAMVISAKWGRNWHLKGKVATPRLVLQDWSLLRQSPGSWSCPAATCGCADCVTKSATIERGKSSAKMCRSCITSPGLNDLWMTPAFSQQCKRTGNKEEICQEPVKPGDSFSDIKAFMSRSSAQIQQIVGHPSTAVLVEASPVTTEEIPNTDILKVKHTLPSSCRPPELQGWHHNTLLWV